MTDATFPPLRPMVRGDQPERVGLRTLVLIRWIAVGGQAATILMVYYGFGFTLPIEFALAAVATSVLFNLILTFRRPLKARIGHVEATLQLGYDILQLGLLLFLTGGLQNPFTLLILAPVTVSATVLPRTDTIILGVLAGLVITVLAVVHFPLPPMDQEVALPDLYLLGLWEALILGTLFIAGYVGSVAEEARRMAAALGAAQLALAREQQLSAVGAMAAAAAHRLGSPLGTIAVTAGEMARAAPPGSELRDDIDLLVAESRRCRHILAELGQPLTPDRLSPMSRLPFAALVESAAAPYVGPDIAIEFDCRHARSGRREDEPVVTRDPQIIQGLGTLIENAIDFARGRVRIECLWDDEGVTVRIRDDGPGFARSVLERFGEPYVSTRPGEGGHMGLGIFIAETLLGHAGARVSADNAPDGGAVVDVYWPRRALDAIMPDEQEGIAR